MKVSELEAALFDCWPRQDAEDWDHVGLSVGQPKAPVEAVACALDATEANVRAAAQLGCNVLLTHHPVYIKAPNAFTPACSATPQAASALYTAAQLGVSIVSNHTNLDRSLDAREELPGLLGLSAESSLEHPSEPERAGLGAIADCEPTTLARLAARAAAAFGTEPRVWGEVARPVQRIAFLGGSLGEFGDYAISAGCDTVITGEAGYHVAQDLCIRGLSVLLLGHDRSEEPFVNILAKTAVRAGVPKGSVHTIDGPKLWWTQQ